jgi:hypothetical protein
MQVYIDKWTNPCQNLTTLVKLTTTNACVKIADARTETQWEYCIAPRVETRHPHSAAKLV